jgi:two-component system, LytTR family, response regulator
MQSAPLSVLIVDDEHIARERIRKLLARDPDVSIVAECASVAHCARLETNIIPDLVFLDVRMPERDGFELLDCFDARGFRPLIIFVTAHSRYAVDAYAAGAIDYLMKPFDDARFAKAMMRSKATLSMGRSCGTSIPSDSSVWSPDAHTAMDRLLVSENRRTLFIPTRDIELIQVAGKHTKIFARDHCYLARQPLRSVEERLDKLRFVRIHRSTIVNVEHIVELRPLLHGDCEVVLRRGTCVNVSRRFRTQLQPFFMRWCGLGAAPKRHS